MAFGATTATDTRFYVHKYAISLNYGGPEEGGWYYESGIPVQSAVYIGEDEEDAYAKCFSLNMGERARQKREEEYDYTSVLARMGNHYTYRVETEAVAEPYPKERPHYE